MPERARISAEQVVMAAEQVVDDHGLDALSVRRLADDLGVSRQVVYTHFGGMHGLFEALHRRSGRRLADRVRALSDPIGSDERLLAAAHAYVDNARSRPAMFELTFGRPIPGYQPSPETAAELRAVFREHIVNLIEEWFSANGIDGDPVESARVFWSNGHGLVTLERAGHAQPAETDALVERSVELLLAGWRSSATSASATAPS